jgi:hypothetical protein
VLVLVLVLVLLRLIVLARGKHDTPYCARIVGSSLRPRNLLAQTSTAKTH